MLGDGASSSIDCMPAILRPKTTSAGLDWGGPGDVLAPLPAEPRILWPTGMALRLSSAVEPQKTSKRPTSRERLLEPRPDFRVGSSCVPGVLERAGDRPLELHGSVGDTL